MTPSAEPFAIDAASLPEPLLRVPVAVQVVIGSTRMAVGKAAELTAGATVLLDQRLGAPVAILVNGREVARGELFVLDGEADRIGVTITELAAPGRG